MAFSTKMELPGTRMTDCGGRFRAFAQGTGVISGTAKFGAGAGTPGPARVFLHVADGTLIGFRRTGADGAYLFRGLAPRDYRLVIEDDRQWAWRPKVELVTIT